MRTFLIMSVLSWCALSACDAPCPSGYARQGRKCAKVSVDGGGAADADNADGSVRPDGATARDAGPLGVALGTAGAPCTSEGRLACEGRASKSKVRCFKGEWLPIGSCDDDERCDSRDGSATQGGCMTADAACLADASHTRCAGDAPSVVALSCTLDGLPVAETCAEGEHCVADARAHCCPRGLRGPGCDVDVDDCAATPCQHGGQCSDRVDGFSCMCPAAWKGDTCGTNVDECTDSSPAVCASGVCTDLEGGFSCACPARGYALNPSGTDCVDVNECGDSSVCGQASSFGACSNTLGTYECLCNQGRTGSSCEVTEQCAAATVCAEGYSCVEETAPKVYRCAGQFPEWPLADPANRFAVSAGVVSDGKTGLAWQQAVDPSSYDWADAKAYCTALPLTGGGWRLPTIVELLSIVDISRANPAIDTSAFPDAPFALFWSSSPSIASPGHLWVVDFYYGYGNFGAPGSAYRVRCVR